MRTPADQPPSPRARSRKSKAESRVSEVDCHAGRKTDVILSVTIKPRVDPVEFSPKRDRSLDTVVETAPGPVAERSVGIGDGVTAADVGVTEQQFSERPQAADLN